MSPPLVLGSGSPRRAALLRQIGLPFIQLPSPEPEPPPGAEPPQDHVVASANAKAAAVRRLIARTRPDLEGAFILGADTLVSLDGRMLGKPADPAAAEAMLGLLAGRTHQVYTGLALIPPSGLAFTAYEATDVSFGAVSPDQIRAYVAGGEPLDKAGAYGIQGRAGRFIEQISGCYYNVVGLPLARLCALMRQAGLDPDEIAAP